MHSFTTVARILKTWGLKGEVSALILTDFPERFSGLKRVWIHGKQQSGWEVIESHRFHKNRLILKFRGRNSPEEVQELITSEAQVPDQERVPLAEGEFYFSDLVGCQLVSGDRILGEVAEVIELGPGVFNLCVTTIDGRELMVPWARRLVQKVSVREKRIEATLPKGLEATAVWPGKAGASG